MGKGLCIIDMQYGFQASQDVDTIWEVIKQVKKAKSQKQPIIVVELNPSKFKKTSPIIYDYLKGYKKTFKVTKNKDDGSTEILTIINKEKLDISDLNVTGVNTAACVFRTCIGLLSKSKIKLKVIKRACNCHSEKPWEEYSKFLGPQLKIGA